MWKLLFSFLSGPLTHISNDLKEAYQSKLRAENDAQRVAADERINLLEARKTIILAAQSDPLERFVRILFALPFIIYIGKIVVYDKVLGLGVTDNLSENFTWIMMTIIGGYFLDSIANKFRKG